MLGRRAAAAVVAAGGGPSGAGVRARSDDADCTLDSDGAQPSLNHSLTIRC